MYSGNPCFKSRLEHRLHDSEFSCYFSSVPEGIFHNPCIPINLATTAPFHICPFSYLLSQDASTLHSKSYWVRHQVNFKKERRTLRSRPYVMHVLIPDNVHWVRTFRNACIIFWHWTLCMPTIHCFWLFHGQTSSKLQYVCLLCSSLNNWRNIIVFTFA